MSEVRVGNVVADLAPLSGGAHEPASPQTREMIAHVRSGQAERCRQFGRVGRAVEECHEDVAPPWVGERSAEPMQRLMAIGKSQHTVNYTLLAEHSLATSTSVAPRAQSASPLRRIPFRRARHPRERVCRPSIPVLNHRTFAPISARIEGVATPSSSGNTHGPITR